MFKKISPIHSNDGFYIHRFIFSTKTPLRITIFYRDNMFDFDPVSIVASFISEIKYAVKSFFSILSGFERLESRYDDGWQEADENYDDSYYVCAAFADGRHIPLPILADWNEDEHKLQKIAIRFAGFFNRKSYELARNRCEDWAEPNV